MARIGLIGSSYRSQDPGQNSESNINWYEENMEQQSKSSGSLYPTPGIRQFVSVPTETPQRGEISIQGHTFAVMGSLFGEIDSAGTFTSKGTVVNNSLRVSMAGGPTQVLIASAGSVYVYNFVTDVFQQLAQALFNDNLITFVGYCDGYFLAVRDDSNEFQISELFDATLWDALDVAAVSRFPDDIESMLVDHDVVWMWGGYQTVVYYDSGNEFPFDVLPGAFIEQGISAPRTPVKMDNSVFWLGGDPRGQAIAWRANGYTPQRVSNHAVEYAMQGYIETYGTIADTVGYSYQDQGHTFWVLYFPKANKTWVFDAATGLWHERGHWNTDTGIFTAHQSWGHVFAFGKHLVGDPFSGKLYEMSINIYTDNETPLRRIRRTPPIATEGQWIFHHQVQIDLETGLGPQPPLTGQSGQPFYFYLEDSNGQVWQFGINDVGQLDMVGTPVTGFTPQTIILNDIESNTVSWPVYVDILGALYTPITPATYDSTYPSGILLATTSGLLESAMQVNAVGQLQTNGPFAVPRDPMLMLRWSDDGGHTWSNERQIQCGQAGRYNTRAMAYRLGRSRERIYEISTSDPIPWRIRSAYLMASPGYGVSERVTTEYAKVS